MEGGLSVSCILLLTLWAFNLICASNVLLNFHALSPFYVALVRCKVVKYSQFSVRYINKADLHVIVVVSEDVS